MRLPTARVGAAAAVVVTSLALGTVGTTTPARAEDGATCDAAVLAESERLADTTVRASAPAARMHVDRAREITDGTGIQVAVLDSGVQPGLPINLGAQLRLPGVAGPVLSGHGTIVAGLIAGKDGVAPGARVIDMRVLDADPADLSQGQKGVSSQGIADGVRRLVDLHRTTPFQVANISLSVGRDDPALRRAVADLVRLDVVVVASAGNADPDEESTTGTAGNDADVYPADYPGVLAVSAVAPGNGDASTYVVPNKDTDVAAPTVDALSYNVTGQRCVVDQVATSWATAEVSGVVALVRAAYPRDDAAQVIARLKATAEGSDEVPNPWTGAGVVQAADALTRALRVGKDGSVARTVQQPRTDAQAPPPPNRVDLFGSSRALLLWAGLTGGALMALAFMLRPLTRR